MSTLGHSTGLLLLDGRHVPDNQDYSFRVVETGTEEWLGWGQTSRHPTLDINPPQGSVHTVHVVDLAGAIPALRTLAAEHVARYGECRMYTYPEDGEIAKWLAAGMPEPDSETKSEDQDLTQPDGWSTEGDPNVGPADPEP